MQVYELLDLKIWDGLASDQREAVAREVGRRLPSSFQYAGLQTHTMGNQTHEIAFFDCARRRFALIPGSEATLGYDRTHPFIPTEEMLADWGFSMRYGWDEETQDEEPLLPPLEKYLEIVMTPLRKVLIKPLLVETVPIRAGLVEVAPEILFSKVELELLCKRPQELTASDKNANFYIEVKPDGEISVKKTTDSTHAEIVTLLTNEGFRLPTSDEWEYLCAAGSRTMWRWGDDHLFTHYFSSMYKNAIYCQPNAFGLTIAYDQSNWEVCATPGLMRGGDGGGSACGSEGIFKAQLTLASAYTLERDIDRPVYGGHVRRVLDLPEE